MSKCQTDNQHPEAKLHIHGPVIIKARKSTQNSYFNW